MFVVDVMIYLMKRALFVRSLTDPPLENSHAEDLRMACMLAVGDERRSIES